MHQNPVTTNMKGSSNIYCTKVSGTHRWTIYNFNLAIIFNGCSLDETLCSGTFSFGNNDDTNWDIELYPTVNNEYIAVKVAYQDECEELVKAECEISILGKDVVHSVKTNSIHNFTAESWIITDFVKKDYLMNEENGLLIKNKLTLFLQIDCSRYYEVKNVNTLEHQIFLSRLKVSDDLCTLMNSNSCDVSLVLKNEKYCVHKCILASRSPVFSAMFDHSMQEQMNGVVVLIDISDETLKKLIHFMYTGVIVDVNEISMESLAELLAAADKYELNDLKEMCEFTFYNMLNISNAIKILILADFHNAENLKTAVVSFINAHIKEFKKTAEFEHFSAVHSHLLPKFIEVTDYRVINALSPSDTDYYKFFDPDAAMQCTAAKKNTWTVTQVLLDKDCYVWKINNFSYLLEKKLGDEPIESPKFGKRKEYSWQLNLSLKEVETKEYISFYINFLSTKRDNEMKACYKFFIIDNEKQKRNEIRSDLLIFISYPNGEKLGVEKFIEKEFLMENKDKLLPNDTLTVMCKIKSNISNSWDTSFLDDMSLRLPKYQFEISAHQIKLFESGKFSDLTLVASNVKIPVHQNILSVRCPAFFSMLSEQLTTEKTVIEISDVDPAVLKNFLLFIYSGHVENLEAMAKDLYVEARKYRIENLELICETYICKNLTLENVCDNFVFAHINSASSLRSISENYIIDNLKEVYTTPGYSNLANSRPQLLKNIIYKL